MTEYIHHIPGRLRVRVTCLRGNEEKTRAITNRLGSVAGVRSAVVNPLTGSVTLHYDTFQTNSSVLLEFLKAEIGVDAQIPANTAGGAFTRSGVDLQKRVGKAIAAYVVEKAIERSLIALVAAL